LSWYDPTAAHRHAFANYEQQLWYFAALAYFMFKLVRMYASSKNRIEDYLPARRTLTSFAVITILLMVITITIACWCMANYGKGLKQYVHGKSRRQTEDSKMYLHDVPGRSEGGSAGAPAPSRMVID
jgi:hypothetical protein